ncbi:unnamed protein product (macronuclear) [Paramecium tetraurelia]|uniref:Transmembrane protein n=1 Tax=Paramecium tetraurelia TaxID=5888 RepID=A0BNZ6_PARTE|nr:uncharacterized protein GSPATT00030902001 [Paramecium tetraurelia]CAK60263.1 unnamed protein product [Paramecium tetraurelia]|eukprot:XP_001427661.1 hypothetical protein (macronuclear) [Paramecium tetraurelia strain d4-2]
MDFGKKSRIITARQRKYFDLIDEKVMKLAYYGFGDLMILEVLQEEDSSSGRNQIITNHLFKCVAQTYYYCQQNFGNKNIIFNSLQTLQLTLFVIYFIVCFVIYQNFCKILSMQLNNCSDEDRTSFFFGTNMAKQYSSGQCLSQKVLATLMIAQQSRKQ